MEIQSILTYTSLISRSGKRIGFSSENANDPGMPGYYIAEIRKEDINIMREIRFFILLKKEKVI